MVTGRLTWGEGWCGQGSPDLIQWPAEKAQVADMQIHGTVQLAVGEGGLLVHFHVLGPFSPHFCQLSFGDSWAGPSLAHCLLQLLLLQLILFQKVLDVLQGGFHIREHARQHWSVLGEQPLRQVAQAPQTELPTQARAHRVQ